MKRRSFLATTSLALALAVTATSAAWAENATLKEQLERCKTRLAHAEANYGEELKRARAFEAQAQELAALLAKQ